MPSRCTPWPCRRRCQQPTCKLPVECCISRRVRRTVRIIVQYSLLTFVLLILILWIGSEVEGYHVAKAPDTLKFYEQEQVCGIFANDTRIQIQTFASQQQAANTTTHNVTIAHCGDCGACSNPQDVRIYDKTKNSLFGTTVDCAKLGLIWGRKTATKCMQERVGFSRDCNHCWVENIMCDLRYCIFTCMWQGLFNQVNTGADAQTLNRCTVCDELRCGPDFVTCAGANRRRCGILSDIERNADQEVCTAVESPWWNDEDLQRQWQQQRQGNKSLAKNHDRLRRP